MPPKKSRKRAAGEAYDGDGGFVEDAPKSKKSKAAATTQAASLDVQHDDDGHDYWQISGKRRLVVNEYNGSTMINIREYYEKDGKTLPGKGIALNIDQYKAFVELLPQIESSLSAKGIEVPRPRYDGDDGAKPEEEKGNRAAKAEHDDEEEEEEEEEPVKSSKSASKLDKFKMKQNPDEEEEEEPVKPSKSASKLDKFKLKQNHEATSDEDDG